MNRYGSLLERISSELRIKQGITETAKDYHLRIIYSAIGRMSAASVWDKLDDTSVSVQHLKDRIRRLIEGYYYSFSEWRMLLQGDNYKENVERIVDEIYDVYLKAGYFYHTPYRIAPATPCCSIVGGVQFCRGLPIGESQFVSGLGTYLPQENSAWPITSADEMFHLSTKDIRMPWENIAQDVQWLKMQTESNVDYLNLRPPFRPYWVKLPDRNCISICKVSTNGAPMYYLYRIEQGQAFYSPIPEWMLLDPVWTGEERHTNYRLFSNSLLACLGILPPTRFHKNGEIVFLNLGYRMPPREMNLIKLYSWPSSFYTPASPFRRVMDHAVFTAIKAVLEKTGFSFEEE